MKIILQIQDFAGEILANVKKFLQTLEPATRQFYSDFPYWIAAFLTGLIAVGYAELIDWAERTAMDFFDLYPYSLLLTGPLCFVAGWYLVFRFAPDAKGSGIPQVMVAIETQENSNDVSFRENLLGLRTLTTKIFSSILIVMGGGAVGREGPTIQIAASVFHFVNRFSKKLSLSVNYHFGLIAGGAAGIAAAFNTPLGGLVFAIEELATSHFNRFKTSLISGVIISGLVAQGLAGTYLYLGYPAIAHLGSGFGMWALAIGGLSGYFGALFGKLLYYLSIKKKQITNPKHLALFAAACGLILAISILYFDKRTAGPGREVVLNLLFKDASVGDLKLAVVRFFAPIVTYLSGGAGGIFAPSLAAGGAIGACLANWFHPAAINIFILLGMIGFLAGVTRAPFTSFVLVLEMTDRHSAIFPMMIAAISASLVARIVDPHSFYEYIKREYLQTTAPILPKGAASPKK